MRRVRADASHRIRRRTSIFAARWFRGLLGVGLIVILALVVGPRLVDRMGVELPSGLTPLLPWIGSAEDTRRSPDVGPPAGESASNAPAVAPLADAPPRSGLASSDPSTGPRDRAAVEASAPVSGPRAGSGTKDTGATGRTVTSGSAKGAVSSVSRPLPAEAAVPKPGTLTPPPTLYWVQVGAFQDSRNAERLVERLRSDGLSAATTVFEQSRVQYRVLLVGLDGGSAVPDETVERVRGLGLPVESTPDGPAVSGLVTLRRAVETSHTLRQQGIRVRLKQEVGSATYRVVRVGSFPTSVEAEATLGSLASRGIEGVVVRER